MLVPALARQECQQQLEDPSLILFCIFLGVTLSSTGTAAAHLHTRATSFTRAAGAFLDGLHAIPSYTHNYFIIYLWSSLVKPVATYGMELFEWLPNEVAPLLKQQTSVWRRTPYIHY